MSTDDQIEKVFFSDPLGQMFFRLTRSLDQMKCNIHGDEEAWNVKHMYAAYLDRPKLFFKVTDKCCCKKFAHELNEKADSIIDSE